MKATLTRVAFFMGIKLFCIGTVPPPQQLPMPYMKKLIPLLLLLLLLEESNAQQNTILIIADDVSPDYFGVYGQSADTANTPHIRKFAEEGIRFDMAWANPVCSPTRAGIFTGRYSFRTGVGGVITNQQSPQLDTAEVSIPELLKYYAPVSYATGCFGKWHLHVAMPQKYLFPNQMGYDAYAGNFNGALNDYYNYVRIKNGIADTVNTYATTQTVTDAINWLDTVPQGKPFFMWLAFNAPHTPFHKPPDTLHTVPGLFGTPGHINNNPKLYFKAALEAVDSEIGRLLLYLQQNNLSDSTNIIFIGDNGNDKRVALIADTSHCKETLYDYGVHIPMMISGPAVVNPGRVSNQLVNTTDLFSTILELSGLTNWQSFIPPAFLPNDSRTLLPEIQNTGAPGRDWIFSEQFNIIPTAVDGKTIRNTDYHLIRFDSGAEEFYNLITDPMEQNNLLTAPLNSTEQSNYNFLCNELSNLTGVQGCNFTGLPSANHNEAAIHVYPNPFNNILNIENDDMNDGILSVSISNLAGQTVSTFHLDVGTNSLTLNADLPAGIYQLQVTTTKAITHRMIARQ